MSNPHTGRPTEKRQIALFRGINVGKAKRVAMADLRGMFERLGFTGVRTLLNSGNVVYTSDGAAPAEAKKLIERGIEKELGVPSLVTILTLDELDDILDAAPLADIATNPSRHQIAFLADGAAAGKLEPLLKEDWTPEAIALRKRALYLWCPDGVANSELVEAVGKALGSAVTMRTWATVLKIQAAAHADPPDGAKQVD